MIKDHCTANVNLDPSAFSENRGAGERTVIKGELTPWIHQTINHMPPQPGRETFIISYASSTTPRVCYINMGTAIHQTDTGAT
jgi:hypothetical protein